MIVSENHWLKKSKFQSIFNSSELESGGFLESVMQIEKMAVHYSEYSSVLEVEKSLLALELGRLGQLLLKTNKDRRKLQETLLASQKSAEKETQHLKETISQKVNSILEFYQKKKYKKKKKTKSIKFKIITKN